MIRNLEIFKYEQFLVPSYSHINLQSALCYFMTISSMSTANRASSWLNSGNGRCRNARAILSSTGHQKRPSLASIASLL